MKESKFRQVGIIGSISSVLFSLPGSSERINMYKLAIIGALFVVSTLAAPASQDAEVAPPSIIEEALDVYGSCSGESNVAVCLKLKALRYVDRVVRSADIEVFDGFKIVQTEEAKNR